MITFEDVQNTELYKDDQKMRSQSPNPEVTAIDHSVYFLPVSPHFHV